MQNSDEPRIVSVDKTGNAALVEFEGDPVPTIYSATLLHAAKELADIMWEEKNLNETPTEE